MRSRWPARLILIISISLSLAGAFAIKKITRDRDTARFNHATEQTRQAIESGLNKYLTLLDSVRAFAVARISINPAQFHSFADALELRQNYQGIESLGVSARIPAAQKEALIQRLRQQGLPEFQIWPPSDQPEICPLITLEPRDARTTNALGYDLFADAERRTTAWTAAENGYPTATPTITIDPENAASGKKGFLVLVPVYKGGGHPETVDERRTNIAGFVYCAFQTRDLLHSILGHDTNSMLALRVYDGPAVSDTSLIYQSPTWSPAKPGPFKSELAMTVAGRPWTLEFASRPGFVAPINPAPITLLAGLALSGMLWAFIVSQTRARETAERHTLQLQQSQAQIQELNTHLEQRVTERTAELQSAVEELKAFSYSVSHDLRAPLRHIEGYVNILSENPNLSNDTEAQRYTKIIIRSARQMGQLIDGLLKFARLGWTQLDMMSVDVDEIVRDVRQMLTPPDEKRAIQWNIAPLPKVTADRTLLRQVFANLISNAVKYSAPRAPAIIEIGSQDHPTETVFYIRDNGVGFDMKYNDKLFQVFQRLHTNDEFEGTGVGLANVRKIVTRHAGRAWAESAPDQGATFYFTLPKTK